MDDKLNMSDEQIAEKYGVEVKRAKDWASRFKTYKVLGIITDKNGIQKKRWINKWTQSDIAKLEKFLKRMKWL